MDSSALVQLALKTLQCTQKELASQLGVSTTQVNKWKKSGGHMSQAMQDKLRTLAQIDDKDPNFVLLAGSLSNSNRWEKLIHYLAFIAQQGAETGYDTEPLNDEYGLLCGEIFRIFEELGVVIPKDFPAELDFDYEFDEDDRLAGLIETDPYVNLIYEIFASMNDVYGFYAAYISELMFDDELDLFDTPACNIEPCLLMLAASKIEDKLDFTPKFRQFKYHIQKDYEEWLNLVKDRAFRAGIPLRAELLHLIYESHQALGHEAEAESLNLNATRIHPDIYMNELLVGMRVIHQVLPAILKKLGIEDEFKLDTSDLRLTERE